MVSMEQCDKSRLVTNLRCSKALALISLIGLAERLSLIRALVSSRERLGTCRRRFSERSSSTRLVKWRNDLSSTATRLQWEQKIFWRLVIPKLENRPFLMIGISLWFKSRTWVPGAMPCGMAVSPEPTHSTVSLPDFHLQTHLSGHPTSPVTRTDNRRQWMNVTWFFRWRLIIRNLGRDLRADDGPEIKMLLNRGRECKILHYQLKRQGLRHLVWVKTMEAMGLICHGIE